MLQTSSFDHLKNLMIAFHDYFYLSYLGPIVQHYSTNVQIRERNDPLDHTLRKDYLRTMGRGVSSQISSVCKCLSSHDTTCIPTRLILHHSLSPGSGRADSMAPRCKHARLSTQLVQTSVPREISLHTHRGGGDGGGLASRPASPPSPPTVGVVFFVFNVGDRSVDF
jgi:hypothetical protein